MKQRKLQFRKIFDIKTNLQTFKSFNYLWSAQKKTVNVLKGNIFQFIQKKRNKRLNFLGPKTMKKNVDTCSFKHRRRVHLQFHYTEE